jgi:hypothetical protein
METRPVSVASMTPFFPAKAPAVTSFCHTTSCASALWAPVAE